jgi:protein involved in polysaccharide export with SLBB domain
MKKTITVRFILILFLSLFSSLNFSAVTEEQQMLLDQLPPDQRGTILNKMNQASDLKEELDEKFENPETLVLKPDLEEDKLLSKCPDCIFGYDFFQFSPTTFAQASNITVPPDYVIGPGDKLKVTLYGNRDETKSSYLSRDGVIEVPEIGPVNLAGLSFKEATQLLKQRVSSELIGTNVYVSLEELRSISVFLLGEAYLPGLYTVSGLSSVANLLFVAGGVNEQGSLRNIQIKRAGKTIRTYDFYELLMKGAVDTDIRLLDGDVVFVPFIENKIKIGGAFKRPHNYEIKLGETIQDAINLAGGFLSVVSPTALIEMSSINASFSAREISYLNNSTDDLNRALKDGDTVTVKGVTGLESRTIKVTGEVLNPGEFSIMKGDTILDILSRAGGFTDEGYAEGAVFLRKSVADYQKEGFERSADELEKTLVNIISGGTIPQMTEFTLTPISDLIRKLRDIEPVGRQVVNLDQQALQDDPYINFRVEEGDELYIPKRPFSIQVIGEVLNPSTLSYTPKYSVTDYISKAGGLSEQADEDKIFVVLPNGNAVILKDSFFRKSSNETLPGSTIVVTRSSRTLDALKLTEIVTPILANLATSAAAIAAISD